MTATIYYEQFKYDTSEELRNYSESPDIQALKTRLSDDVVIVLGGDGTMLRAIQKYHGEGKKFLWLNFWTKWFLLNPKIVDLTQNFQDQIYTILRIKITTKEGDIIEGIATNEITVRSTELTMNTLKISTECSGKSIQMSGDGLIISTPAGSTGYNVSLGGPIIPHNIPALVITPMAPWSPKSQRPIMMSDDSKLCITDDWRKPYLDVYVDNIPLIKRKNDVTIQVQKHEHPLSIMVAESELQNWKNRVFQEQWFQ
jgi:NAD+ kinase